jgi:hypothetical protein
MRRSVVIAAGAVVVVAVLAATLLLRPAHRSSAGQTQIVATDTTRSSEPFTGPAATVPVGPTAVIAGVPMGWRHDTTGARAAAISTVALTPRVARAGFVTQRDMVSTLATTAYGSTLGSVTATQVDELLFALGAHDVSPAELLLLEQPVTAQVQAFSPDVATVAVWSVVVVGVPGSVPPRQAWRTVTVRVRWEREDWRVDDWTVTAGPNPAASPELAPADYETVAAVADWPAANNSDQG